MIFPFYGFSAQTLATCSDPEGYALYHHSPSLPKAEGGFQKDRVTGGITTLQRLEDGGYDVMLVDARKTIISYRHDGGSVVLLRKGSREATFLVVFPGMAIELYTFYIDERGAKRFDMLQSKGGDDMPIGKSAVLSGSCSELNLGLIK
jgi:hypothetical protein